MVAYHHGPRNQSITMECLALCRSLSRQAASGGHAAIIILRNSHRSFTQENTPLISRRGSIRILHQANTINVFTLLLIVTILDVSSRLLLIRRFINSRGHLVRVTTQVTPRIRSRFNSTFHPRQDRHLLRLHKNNTNRLPRFSMASTINSTRYQFSTLSQGLITCSVSTSRLTSSLPSRSRIRYHTTQATRFLRRITLQGLLSHRRHIISLSSTITNLSSNLITQSLQSSIRRSRHINNRIRSRTSTIRLTLRQFIRLLRLNDQGMSQVQVRLLSRRQCSVFNRQVRHRQVSVLILSRQRHMDRFINQRNRLPRRTFSLQDNTITTRMLSRRRTRCSTHYRRRQRRSNMFQVFMRYQSPTTQRTTIKLWVAYSWECESIQHSTTCKSTRQHSTPNYGETKGLAS